MSATYELFGRWKAAKGLQSDAAAMLLLGLSPGTAHHWKTGRNASAHVIERMAHDLGEDPIRVIIQVFEETAPTEADRKTWKRMAKRLGAAVLVAGMLLPVSPDATAKSESRCIHYAKTDMEVTACPSPEQLAASPRAL